MRAERPALSARAAAAIAVGEVIGKGRSLREALAEVLVRLPESRERAFAQALAFETCRWYPRQRMRLAGLMSRPIKREESVVQALLACGLTQLLELGSPEHAAVAATVEVTRELGKPWATGLVNAVLRNAQRHRADLLESASRDRNELGLAHPAWLIERIRVDWPEQADAIFEAANTQAPLWLRVNRARSSRDAQIAALTELGAAAHPHLPDAIRLPPGTTPAAVAGLESGECSVQDAAAQLCAELMDLKPGQRVLDACAAPGGKAAHMLEQQPTLELLAIDSDAVRLERVASGLRRLGLDARLLAADAAATGDWWDGRPFARILLDAPCSGTGVIRRHPDIKLLRRPEDIAAQAALQRRLLDALWPLLEPGGRLVYATCSILREENAQQVAAFLARHSDARALPVPEWFGDESGAGRQNLPGRLQMDGFFYACLQKLNG